MYFCYKVYDHLFLVMFYLLWVCETQHHELTYCLQHVFEYICIK